MDLLKDRSSLVGYVKGPNGPIPLTIEVLSILENFVIARSFSVSNVNLADKEGKTITTAVRFPIGLEELKHSVLCIYNDILNPHIIPFIDYYYLVLLVEKFYSIESGFRPVLANLIKYNLLLSSFNIKDDVLDYIYKFCFDKGTSRNVCGYVNRKVAINLDHKNELKDLLKNYSYIRIDGDSNSHFIMQVVGLLPVTKYAPAIKNFLNRKSFDIIVFLTQEIKNKQAIKLLFTHNFKDDDYEVYRIKGTELINANDRKNYIRFIELKGC